MDVTHALWRKHRLKCLNRNPDAPVLTWCDAPLIMPNCGKFIQPCFTLLLFNNLCQKPISAPCCQKILDQTDLALFYQRAVVHWPVMALLFFSDQNKITLDFGIWHELLSSLLFSSSSQLRLKKTLLSGFLGDEHIC